MPASQPVLPSSPTRPTRWLRLVRQPIWWFVLLYIALGVATLPHYGLTWDEGYGNLFFGERYFLYFATGFNPVYLDFNRELYLHTIRPLNLFLSPMHNIPWEFPPIADTVSAGSMYLFSYWLGWLDPVDGFHLSKVILAGLFLAVLYYFAKRYLSRTAAWVAVIGLGCFPRFWADMHFNPKDVPVTILIGLTVMAYLIWYEREPGLSARQSLGWAVLIGFLWGAGLGIKANAVFVPVMLLIGILPWNLRRADWALPLSHLRRRWVVYLTIGLVALAVYIGTWPYLYADPIGRLGQYWGYILAQGGRRGEPYWTVDALRQAVLTFPEVMLVVVLLGLVALLAQRQRLANPVWRVVLVWLVFPIARSSMPGVVNFDGIRHFMEYLPAAALLAGLGVEQAGQWLAGRLRQPAGLWRGLIVAALLVNLGGGAVQYGPFLHLYYNGLAGGLSGARSGFLGGEATDYWAGSYRQGMAWLSGHAEPNARLYTGAAEWLPTLTRPIWLRGDIQLVDQIHQEGPVTYVMAVTRTGYLSEPTRQLMTVEEPVFQIEVDDVPVLVIYRVGP